MLSHVLVPDVLVFHLLTTTKKDARANFWSHNVYLTPLLLILLLEKRSRQLVPCENENDWYQRQPEAYVFGLLRFGF